MNAPIINVADGLLFGVSALTLTYGAGLLEAYQTAHHVSQAVSAVNDWLAFLVHVISAYLAIMGVRHLHHRPTRGKRRRRRPHVLMRLWRALKE